LLDKWVVGGEGGWYRAEEDGCGKDGVFLAGEGRIELALLGMTENSEEARQCGAELLARVLCCFSAWCEASDEALEDGQCLWNNCRLTSAGAQYSGKDVQYASVEIGFDD
jgi:hypothetical protein